MTEILLVVVFALCGGTIYISIFLILSTFSFWFEDRIGIHPPVWNLIAFGRWPLSIYAGYIKFFLSWIVPFAFAAFYPTARLLGRHEFRGFAYLVPVMAAATLARGDLVLERRRPPLLLHRLLSRASDAAGRHRKEGSHGGRRFLSYHDALMRAQIPRAKACEISRRAGPALGQL